jgi:tetratricopeptide (TPR) repeat protein
MMSFWFPLYSLSQKDYRMIMRSFLKAFPHASLWYVNTNVNPYTIIVGSQQSFTVDMNRLALEFNATPVAEDLRLIGIESPWDLLNCFVMAEGAVTAFCGTTGPLNTDARPLIEYSAPRLRKIGREGSWLLNFHDVASARTPVAPYVVIENETVSARRAMEEKLSAAFDATGPLLDGQLAQLAGDRDAALALYLKTLSLNPENHGAKTLIEYLYREKGERFRREKKIELALQAYQQALLYGPRSAKTHNNIATLYLSLGNTALAETHFKQAIESDAGYVTPRLNLGFLYRETGQRDRAVEQFRAVREIDPANAVALQALEKASN